MYKTLFFFFIFLGISIQMMGKGNGIEEFDISSILLIPNQKRDYTVQVENYKGYPLVTEKYNERIIHKGVLLFPTTLRKSQYSPYLRFIERTLNKQISQQGYRKSFVPTSDSVFTFEKSIVKFIGDTACIVNIEETKSKIEITLKSTNNATTKFSVPKDVQLIAGKNLLELGRNLSLRLKGEYKKGNNLYRSDLWPIEVTILDGLFTSLNPKINDNGNCDPICQNLYDLFCDTTNTDLPITIKHVLYGNFKEIISSSASSWRNLCVEQNCYPYLGPYDISGDNADMLLAFYDHSLGYVHLMRIKCVLSKANRIIEFKECRLNSYIPISNLTSLINDDNYPR